jgi:hypothetical protein
MNKPSDSEREKGLARLKELLKEKYRLKRLLADIEEVEKREGSQDTPQTTKKSED